MAERVGRTWDEVRAGLKADVEKADAELAEAEAVLRQAREDQRDAIGVARYFRRKKAELGEGADLELHRHHRGELT